MARRHTGGKRDHRSVTTPEREECTSVDFRSTRNGTSRDIDCATSMRSGSVCANEESEEIAKWRTVYAYVTLWHVYVSGSGQ